MLPVPGLVHCHHRQLGYDGCLTSVVTSKSSRCDDVLVIWWRHQIHIWKVVGFSWETHGRESRCKRNNLLHYLRSEWFVCFIGHLARQLHDKHCKPTLRMSTTFRDHVIWLLAVLTGSPFLAVTSKVFYFFGFITLKFGQVLFFLLCYKCACTRCARVPDLWKSSIVWDLNLCSSWCNSCTCAFRDGNGLRFNKLGCISSKSCRKFIINWWHWVD